MKKNAGFTIVEILASAVVIAVLIALVITGIGKFQANANAARCISNLRAIGLGLAAFSAENNGRVMPKVPKGLVPWPPIIDSYVGGNGLSINAHMITSRVWACPENKSLIRAFKKNGSAGAFDTGYPINRKLTETTDDEQQVQGIPMARIQNPSHKVYIVESCRKSDGAFGPATTMEYTPYGYKDWMKQVHPGGRNVLFCDGHVELVPDTHELCSETVSIAQRWWSPGE